MSNYLFRTYNSGCSTADKIPRRSQTRSTQVELFQDYCSLNNKKNTEHRSLAKRTLKSTFPIQTYNFSYIDNNYCNRFPQVPKRIGGKQSSFAIRNFIDEKIKRRNQRLRPTMQTQNAQTEETIPAQKLTQSEASSPMRKKKSLKSSLSYIRQHKSSSIKKRNNEFFKNSTSNLINFQTFSKNKRQRKLSSTMVTTSIREQEVFIRFKEMMMMNRQDNPTLTKKSQQQHHQALNRTSTNWLIQRKANPITETDPGALDVGQKSMGKLQEPPAIPLEPWDSKYPSMDQSLKLNRQVSE